MLVDSELGDRQLPDQCSGAPNGVSNAGGVGRNHDSEPISGFSTCY